MSLDWVRLDTSFPDNPKVLDLIGANKHRAVVAYICSLTYAGRHETGGRIPRGALPFIHATKRDAEALVKARLWDEVDGEWWVHDYDLYQLTNVTQEHRITAAKLAACRRWHQQPCDKCGVAVAK